ncbi:MAG TPA: hypothetical protein VIY72_12290 [Acidimicrobiales bacterium]
MTKGRVRAGMVGLVACTVLVLGACAESNTPTDYNDLTQQNFLETCTNFYYENTDGTVVPSEPTSDTVVADYDGASSATCQCRYEVFEDNMSIEDFTTLNSDLKDDPEGAWAGVPPDIQTKLNACPGGSTTSTTAASQGTTTTAG